MREDSSVRQDDRKPTRHSGGWPLGLLGMVVVTAVVELAGARWDSAFSSYHGTSWRATTRQVRSVYSRKTLARGLEPEVIVLGDSLIKFGMYPRVMKAVSGRRAENLAITTGPPPASYMLLRRVLARGGRPRAVVLDAAERVLLDGPRSTTRVYPWADLLTFGEAAEIAWTLGDPDFFVRVALSETISSFKNRFEIREAVRTVLRGEVYIKRFYNDVARHNWWFNHGAQINPARTYTPPSPLAPPKQGLPGTWVSHPANTLYLERLFELARANDVAVFWLIPPYHPHKQSWYRYLGDESRLDAFVESMLARHPEVVVIDGRHSGYPAEVFTDDAHLDQNGGTALSAAVAGLVGERLDRPAERTAARRVKLPDYQPTTSPIPLVGFDASRQIVLAQAARREFKNPPASARAPETGAGRAGTPAVAAEQSRVRR